MLSKKRLSLLLFQSLIKRTRTTIQIDSFPAEVIPIIKDYYSMMMITMTILFRMIIILIFTNRTVNVKVEGKLVIQGCYRID